MHTDIGQGLASSASPSKQFGGQGVGDAERAPLLLEEDCLDEWLSPSSTETVIMSLVRETDGEGLEFYPVSATFGRVKEYHKA